MKWHCPLALLLVVACSEPVLEPAEHSIGHPTPQSLLGEALREARRAGQRREYLLHRIAVAQAEAGFPDAAQRTLLELEQASMAASTSYLRAEGLTALAKARASHEPASSAALVHFARAIVATGEVQDVWDRIQLLLALAKAQAQVGLRQGSRATFDLCRTLAPKLGRYSSWQAAHEVAIAEAETGDVEAAVATANSLSRWPHFRARALTAAALALTGSGEEGAARVVLAAALESAHHIDDDGLTGYRERAVVLANIGSVQLIVGQRSEARDSLTMAAAAAASPETPPRDQSWAFRGIALALLEAGDVVAAAAILPRIEVASDRADVLAAIALVQITAGDVASGLTSLERVEKSGVQGNMHALCDLTLAKASAGMVSSALQTLETVRDEDQRESLLHDLVLERAQHAGIEVALYEARNYLDSNRPLILAHLAIVLAGRPARHHYSCSFWGALSAHRYGQ